MTLPRHLTDARDLPRRAKPLKQLPGNVVAEALIMAKETEPEASGG